MSDASNESDSVAEMMCDCIRPSCIALLEDCNGGLFCNHECNTYFLYAYIM